MKKIVFDLDNTLFFISNDWSNTFQQFIDKYNLDLMPEDLYSSVETFEKNNSDTIVTKSYFSKYMSGKLSINISDEMIDEFLDDYANIPLLYIDVIYDLLMYLSQKYELIAYTNWFTENQIQRLKKYNLDSFFSCIYGWDILPVKPSKEGLNTIIKGNEVSNFLFIGDSIKYDLELPDSYGTDTIFYNRKGIEQSKYKQVLKIEEIKKML